MPRVYNDVGPTVTPTPEDLLWAATIFNIRGRRLRTGTRVYVRIDIPEPTDVPTRLVSLFGGRRQHYGSTKRWTISGPRMYAFFEQIGPHLDTYGRQTVQLIQREDAHLNDVVAEIDALKERRSTAMTPAARRVAEPRPHIDLILSSEDFDQLDVIRILLEDAPSLTLSTATEAYATTWRDEIVAHLNDLISDVTVTGTIIRVTKRLAE